MNGPYINEQSKGHYQVWVAVDVLITAHMNAKDSRFELHRLAGIYQAAIDGNIPLWNYGNQPGDYDDGDSDTQIFLGCLRPRNTKQPAVKVLHFGQVDKTETVRQSAVDAELETYLDE
ncbi:MAG: hypothetical protein KDA84_09500 [Planctomycetaceae bacterium]|nr:hypothetical protein [Planctomycetaceae bacterium]